VLLFVVLIPFVGFGELQRVLGAGLFLRAPRKTKRPETSDLARRWSWNLVRPWPQMPASQPHVTADLWDSCCCS
jgi:hypothetical protein